MTQVKTNKQETNKTKVKTANYSKKEEFIYSLVIKQFLKENPELLKENSELLKEETS